MSTPSSKKRKVQEGMRGRITRPKKKVKKQLQYHSDSSDEDSSQVQGADFKPVNLQDSGAEDAAKDKRKSRNKTKNHSRSNEDDDASHSEPSDASEVSDDSAEENSKKRKRNDPDAFAVSMSKILGTKLSTSRRSDPVLSRSKDAATAAHELSEARLEAKARHKLREERRAELDRGRIRDVLGVEGAAPGSGLTVSESMGLERRLRKTAQRGVVKLFNAVRAAQVKAEEAAREARNRGLVGQKGRQEKINEMSKQGFLDLIAGGGQGTKLQAGVEEA